MTTELKALTPGENNYTNTFEPDPKPPEGFVDSTVYLYKIGPNGEEIPNGIQDPFPEGSSKAQSQKKGRPKTMTKPKNYLHPEDSEKPETTDTTEEPAPNRIFGKHTSRLIQIFNEGSVEELRAEANELKMYASVCDILADFRASQDEVHP